MTKLMYITHKIKVPEHMTTAQVEQLIKTERKVPFQCIYDEVHAEDIACTCDNADHGFDCTCAWSAQHPGDNQYTCEFCGIYTADTPMCNKCEKE